MLFAFTDVPPELRPMAAAWLAFLGACIGSFLNVVVYRLPRGLNLVFPASACPACGHAIRWYHNVPIVGWLVLRGRCKDCRAPISARYPLVEAAVGAIFLVLALAGPLSPRVEAIGRVNFNNDWIGAVRWAAYPYHLLLVCGLVALVLIEGDARGNGKDEGGRMKDESRTGDAPEGGAAVRYPWGLFWFVLVVGLLGPLGWLVAPLFGASGVVLDGDTLAHVKGALIDRGLGVGAAWLLGPALGPAVRIASTAPRPARWAVGNLMLIGAYLGWQAVCVVAAFAALFYLLATLVARCRPAWVWSAWLVPIGLLWIVIGFDPSLLGGEPWLGLPAPFVLAAGSLGVAVLLSIATWAICGRSLN